MKYTEKQIDLKGAIMKKYLFLTTVLTTTILFVGCTQTANINDEPTTAELTVEEPTTKPEEATVPADDGKELFGKLTEPFIFTSGVGAWGTQLNISADGSFDGNFHDSDMGNNEPDYPHGVVYYCDFKGQFGEVKKINDYTYSMKMLHIEYEQEPNTNEVKDGFMYQYAAAYGLDEADEIWIYTPDTPVSELAEGFFEWTNRLVKYDGDKLGFYGLYNVNEGEGFVSDNK